MLLVRIPTFTLNLHLWFKYELCYLDDELSSLVFMCSHGIF